MPAPSSGVSGLQSGRYLEFEVDGIARIVVRRAKNAFWPKIEGRRLHIYTVSGQSTEHDMRFDAHARVIEVDRRLQLLEQTTEQLRFDLTTPSSRSPPT